MKVKNQRFFINFFCLILGVGLVLAEPEFSKFNFKLDPAKEAELEESRVDSKTKEKVDRLESPEDLASVYCNSQTILDPNIARNSIPLWDSLFSSSIQVRGPPIGA